MNKNGGPAFPYSALEPDPETRSIVGSMYADNEGMTLRDYFAGQVLAGWSQDQHHIALDYSEVVTPRTIAKAAYEIADAMLKARENER